MKAIPVPDESNSREAVLIVAALGTVAAAVTILRWLPGVNPATAGFALLILVLLAATRGPQWIAVTVAIASTLSFNYFFFPPLGTFSIAEPHNWVSLIAFLITAVVGSNLSAAAQARARQLQRGELATTLLATLSHDLKTPLTAIRVAVANLRGDMPGDERRAQADAADAELSRLTQLFDGILDMARIDAEAVSVQRQWVTPGDVVDAAMAHARHAVDRHAIHVDADDSHVVHVDARLAAIALSHLIENASRYSPPDRRILVDARTGSDGLTMVVTDHGRGLDADEIDHLFERFYRGRLAQQTAPGTGMGLAITRGLLNAIGGRVWAENAPNAGARFSIVIPGPTRSAEAGA
jgi:two-component system sensor histidine kinase KdpD